MTASRLGHTSVRTVLDVYGHPFEGLDRDIADALDALSDAPAACFLPTSGQNKVIEFPQKTVGTLAVQGFQAWALTGSNRRPLPCKGF